MMTNTERQQEFYDQTLYHLARRICFERIMLDWTQEDLAKHAGVSPNTVTNLERGSAVSLEVLCKICLALGLGVEVAFKDVSQAKLDRYKNFKEDN